MSMFKRWLIVMFAVLALAAAAFVVHRQFIAERVLRVAVEQAGGTDAQLITAMNDWMQAEGRRYRFRLVVTGSAAESQRLLRARQVEMASVRADAVTPGNGISSIAMLYQEVAILLAVDGARIASWADLNRRAIAAAANTDPKDPLIQALLKLHRVDESLVVSVTPEVVRQDIQKKTLFGVVQVSPMPGNVFAGLRRTGMMRDPKIGFSVIEVADAETLAKRDRRYAEATVPAGAVRASPPLPDEALSTLGVARHLMVRDALNSYMVNRLVHAMLDAKRVLLPQHPALAQMGAPDLEADAFVKVHRGPKALYNGEEQPISEVLLEWIYLVPLVAGLFGTGLMGVWRWLRLGQPNPAEALVRDLLDVRRRAAAATSIAELSRAKQGLDALAEKVLHLAEDRGKLASTGPLLTALDLAERQIDSRRAELDRVGRITGRAV